MPNRGGFNRRTGKTTPRNKAKTHWAKGHGGRSTAAASSPSKTKSPAR